VTDRNSLENLYETAKGLYGEIDILVISAGYIDSHSIEELPESEWAQFLDIILTGTYRAIQIFGREMDSGSIITISSISAWYARANRSASSSAKSGVNGLTRAAAADLGPGIRVNAIAPGYIETPLWEDASDTTDEIEMVRKRTALGRVGQPEEIVGAAIYLASDAASYTTGQVLAIDGAYTVGTIN